MNFSNSRSYFNTFMKNISKNKYSQNYVNSATNSKKSLINFANNYTYSNLLTLSRMISSIKLSALLRFSTIQADSEATAATSTTEIPNNQNNLIDIRTLLYNEISMIKNYNFFIFYISKVSTPGCRKTHTPRLM